MKRIVITGATGFLGFRTVQKLKEKGHEIIGLGRDLARGEQVKALGANFIAASLESENKLTLAFQGADAVVHCAALSSPWGKLEDFVAANVTGTQNVIAAIKRAGVPRLVHISTPSIYIEPRDRLQIGESDPLPFQFINHYAKTKWQAECAVDEAFRDGLITVTLRPQGIFGPRDPHLLPRLLKLGARGRLPMIGTDQTLIDFTYVDNVVDAIELALGSGKETYGKKYNITNGDPRPLYPVFENLLSDLGYSVKRFRVPYGVAKRLAYLNEKFHALVLPAKEPVLTQYSVSVLGFTRTLNIEAATRDLGYEPRVSLDMGLAKTVEWFKGQAPR